MKKLQLRMSLGSMLLCITLLAVTYSHVTMSQRMAAMQRELMNYRYQYGHLEIRDPTRAHILKYAGQDNPWKWHLYLPKGSRYKLKAGFGQVPLNGLPDVSTLQHVTEVELGGSGENQTVIVVLADSAPGSLRFTIGSDKSQTSTQVLRTADVFATSVFNGYRAGVKETYMAEANAPFVIFYQTDRTTTAPTNGPVLEKGVIVWAEPVK